ncbi:MAG: hypothetical protein AABZ55_03085 [Bdellovibrionota bacterium]
MKLNQIAVMGALLIVASCKGASAGTFSLPHFVNPGEFALGFEPELSFTNGAGLSATARYTHGITEVINLTGALGTGGGARKFRVGTAGTFDLFPDIEGQPGIGLAAQAMYFRLAESGEFELTGIPYIHKSFITGKSEIEPFLSIPLGWAFVAGNYKAVSTLSIGALFKTTENVRYVMEFGIAINNTESYLSGGVVYYH